MEAVNQKLKEAEIVINERYERFKKLEDERNGAIRYQQLQKQVSMLKASLAHRKLVEMEEELKKIAEGLEKKKEQGEKLNAAVEKIEQDLQVYVHFWHKNNLLLQDDHIPEVPISDWDADQEYVYSRRIYIPEFIDEFDPEFKGEETLRLSVGISSPYDSTDETQQEIMEKKLKVFPPP